MHRLFLLILPMLLLTSLFIITSEAIGQTRPDIVDHFGFGWCGDKPCYRKHIAIYSLHDQANLPTIGEFVRMFGVPCGVRLVQADCRVDHGSLQRMCHPRQVAVLYPTLMITVKELASKYGAEFSADQATESVALTDLEHNYCKSLTINDVTWHGFIPLERYWP